MIRNGLNQISQPAFPKDFLQVTTDQLYYTKISLRISVLIYIYKLRDVKLATETLINQSIL